MLWRVGTPLDIDDLVVGVLANLQMSTGDVPALMIDLALLGELDGTLVVDRPQA